MGWGPAAGAQSKHEFGPNPNLAFGAAVKADGLIYVSGAIVAAAKGDVRAQTHLTFPRIHPPCSEPAG